MIGQGFDELSNLLDLFRERFEPIILFLLVITFIIFIWLGGRFIKFFINRISRIPPDVRNAINLLISITQLFIITMGSFSLLGASQEFLLAFSAIIATVVGFASSSVASNIFGGLYLIITRPFRVGDLIKTQGAIGIVEEIGLNYTKIVQLDRTSVVIPNSNILNASLLNYSTIIPQSHQSEERGLLKAVGSALFVVPELFVESHYVKYRALIQFQLSIITPPISLKTLKDRLDKVCDKFTPIFGFKPEYYFGTHTFRQNVFLLVNAPDGYTIFNFWPYLMESIIETVFVELQEGENQ